MANETGEQLAMAIVDGLFTSGSGSRADRLVLTSKDGRDMGGWGDLPLRDRLLPVCEEAAARRAELSDEPLTLDYVKSVLGESVTKVFGDHVFAIHSERGFVVWNKDENAVKWGDVFWRTKGQFDTVVRLLKTLV